MKGILIVILVFCSGFLFAEEEREGFEKRQIIENLVKIKESYFQNLNRRDRREAIELMDRPIELVKKSSGFEREKHKKLSNEGFLSLLSQVANAHDGSEKTRIVLTIGKEGRISSIQLKQLLDTYNFDDDKITCIKSAYNNVYDNENINIAKMTIKNSILRAQLQDYINNQSAETIEPTYDKSHYENNDRNKLSDEGFQSLLKQVSGTLDGNEKTRIILTIGKEGKISSSQFKQLLDTYNFDNDKVECIKSVYKNVYDRVNINLVLSTVRNSILRSQLADYINNNQ
jgi:Ca2+-binding EF-hand superfamily protein